MQHQTLKKHGVTDSKKVGVSDLKNPKVSERYCIDCEYSEEHSTGSQIWLSCKFQQGWRSISSQCNLPEIQK